MFQEDPAVALVPFVSEQALPHTMEYRFLKRPDNLNTPFLLILFSFSLYQTDLKQ